MSELPFVTVPPVTTRRRRVLTDPRWSVPAFLVSSVLLGALTAPVWAWLAYRPGYEVRDDLTARISERGLAEVFASDALFAFVTAGLGLVVGVAGWLLFHRIGWWVALLTVVGAGLTSLTLWRVGLLIGQQGFAERLAVAGAGDVVTIDLALHALSALLVGSFTAITVVMLFAAFWPEPKDAADADEAAPVGH